MAKDLIKQLKKKYPDIKKFHLPRENCKYCDGTGEKYFKNIKLWRPCLCTYMDHDKVDEFNDRFDTIIDELLDNHDFFK